MIIIVKILIAIAVLLIVIYASSPLYLQAVEKRINRIDGAEDYKASKNSKDLHSTLFIIDLHCDSLLSYRNLLQRSSSGHSDIPRLVEGNIGLQVFGAATLIPLFPDMEKNDTGLGIAGFLAFLKHWPLNTWFSPKNRALYQGSKLHNLEDKSKGALEIIKTSNQLENYYKRYMEKTHITAGLLALEGAHVINSIPGDIDELFDQGFRIIGLTHLTDNKLGGSRHGAQKGGLTEFGKNALRRMEKLEMIIDLTHASSKLTEDVLNICSRPVMVSHTGVKGCMNNNRNLSDRQIKAIAENGGLIGIGFWKEAVGKSNVEAIVNSIKHTSDLVGIKHVALGSDFDGGVSVPFDAAGMVHITEELMRQGFSEREIRMIMGENALNFLINSLPKQ